MQRQREQQEVPSVEGEVVKRKRDRVVEFEGVQVWQTEDYDCAKLQVLARISACFRRGSCRPLSKYHSLRTKELKRIVLVS